MALTALLLSEAVSGAHRRGYIGNIAPYEFATDNISECSAEMDYVIMAEGTNLAEMFMVTDEIMCEAAISNPGALDALSESVFSKLKDGIKKFFDKIISMVKGIIDKLKAFFYKMTGKTEKWLNVMKPKIQDVKSNQTGYQNVKAETYPYNENYIMNGMNEGVAKLATAWKDSANGKGVAQLAEMVKASVKTGPAAYEDGSVKEGEKAAAVDKNDSKLRDLEAEAKAMTKMLEDAKKEFPKKVAQALDCPSATTLDAVWTACAKKARGDKSEKTTVQIGDKVDSMISALENLSDSTDKLKTTYEGHLKDLVDFRSNLDEDDFKVEDNDKVPGNIMTAIRATVSATYKFISEVTTMTENAMNTAKSKNLAYLQEMATSYMSSLTTFANYKAPKKA